MWKRSMTVFQVALVILSFIACSIFSLLIIFLQYSGRDEYSNYSLVRRSHVKPIVLAASTSSLQRISDQNNPSFGVDAPAKITLQLPEEYRNDANCNGHAELISSSFYAKYACSKTSLRVYMYDLPRRFNIGLLRPDDSNQDLPWPENDLPTWANWRGLSKQHNLEYWMMMSLLGDQTVGIENRSAVRVKNPTDADVFFVPFFSSLSFNLHSHYLNGPNAEQDMKLQIDVVNFLTSSKWWQRSEGRDHVVVIHHPNAFRFLRDRLNASILIVADFGRLLREVASLEKDVVAPYTHMVPTYKRDDQTVDPYASRTILLFFQGRIHRKGDGFVRARLARMLRRNAGVHFREGIATTDNINQVAIGMRASKFCLHPAGDTPSACRLFDAIVSHCVPVIVSDHIELPFEDELDYKEFSVFFSVADALRPGHLLHFLHNFDKAQWLIMWQRLKQVSHHFEYQYPIQKDDAVNMVWRQVHAKLPSVKLAIHRSRRLVIPR